MHAQLCVRILRGVATTAFLLAGTSGRAADVANAQTSWQGVERVIAFADVHGAYGDLVPLLQKAGVVDRELHWSAATTHVVSLGDLFDRGGESRKVIELLMRLQGEATAAGGQLHVVLGNHEAMNLLGDLRYVTREEYASYVTDEPAGEREKQRAHWAELGLPAADFDAKFPPGYFGHRAMLSPDGRFGRWLLSLPVAISINDTLFMHGGVSQVLTGQKLPEINVRYRTALVDHLRTAETLRQAGLLQPNDEFAQWASAAERRLAERTARDPAADKTALADAVAKFKAADSNAMLESDGPNWYRGTALCNECAERDVLQPVLDGLGLKRLVIGHTVTRSTRVATRFDGAVFKLDTGMNKVVYKGHPSALVFDKAQTPVVIYADADGPPREAPAEGIYLSSQSLTETEVEALLANGTVTVSAPRSPAALDVTVERDGQRVAAVFVEASRDAVGRELAAWKLDQVLGLGLVPATVEREVQGKRGYLQGRPAKWVSQVEAQAQGLRGGGACAFEPQFQLMYAFDVLSGNEGRTPDRVLFDTAQWSLLLTGHDRAFGTGTGLPAYLKAKPPQPGAELRRRLTTRLDAADIEREFGTWLNRREQKALLARRDALLQAPAAAAGASR